MEAREIVPKKLKLMTSSVRNKWIGTPLLKAWEKRSYAMPAPTAVKWAVLHRYGGPTDTWIETGTYFGDTTDFLARCAKHVYSIEPSYDLATRAMKRFASRDNVTIIHGLSEDHLGGLLDSATGPVSLWLDGHFSSGVTFQGPIDTPIRSELEAITQRILRLHLRAVCIDDARCFEPDNENYRDYPGRSWLVQWADALDLNWTIEHDIFVATTKRTHEYR